MDQENDVELLARTGTGVILSARDVCAAGAPDDNGPEWGFSTHRSSRGAERPAVSVFPSASCLVLPWITEKTLV